MSAAVIAQEAQRQGWQPPCCQLLIYPWLVPNSHLPSYADFADALLFLPKVLVALLVLIFGAYFGSFVGQSVTAYCHNAGIGDADLLGRIAKYAIMVFVFLLAIDHLDIGGRLVQQTFLILLAGVVVALALAFGIGGKDWAARLLEQWWPRNKPDREP
jgi:acetyl esterase/lipase